MKAHTMYRSRRFAPILLALALLGLQAAPVLAEDPVPSLNLSFEPLFNGRGNIHPNMILDLSVEYPTVGAAYRAGYLSSKEYLGYFNPKKCYTYPTSVSNSSSSSNPVYGTAVINNTSTPSQDVVTTKMSADGLTTTTTTVTDQVAVSGSTYTATVYATVSSGRLDANSHTGWVHVYTGFNSSTGAFANDRYYCSNNCDKFGTSISSSTTLYTNPQTPIKSTTYSHTSKTTTETSTSIPYPDLSEENGYFRIHKDAATDHSCGGDSFSGNFLNWAASSSIDMLRYAMTGGDRVIDTASETVLQRAYLPDGSYNSNENFYASSSYFPRKSVTDADSVTPFSTADASTLYIVSCRDRILFSNTSTGGSCDTARVSGGVLQATDKRLGEYRARVKVCDSNEGPTRTDLCSKYGSNYKPEGTLQRYADKIRAGAFGYLTDSYNTSSPYYVDNLYGGVLRAPAKYVGAKKYEAPSYTQKDNDQAEWDPSTGVFNVNPLGHASGNSGVINYLNKFGRTDPARPGAYKTKDPVSELYYESLRYLQGKQPTNGGSNATSAVRVLGNASSDSNFPVLKTWEDPITASCQSNYVVVIGDVNTHQDGYIPGSQALGSDGARSADSDTTQWPVLDVATSLNKLSAMEVDASGTYHNPAPRSGLANLATRTDAGSSNGTFNLAGLAYWANTNDIRKDKPVRVKTFAIDVDELGNGSIEDTNPRARKPRNSAFYLAGKYGGFLDKGDRNSSDASKKPDDNPFVTLDIDGKTVLYNNTEWTDAPTGTDPSHYFLASQPEKMIAAIKNIFRVASTNSGTISGVTLTSTNISSTGTAYVYQPGFDPSKWSGTLLKLGLTLVDGKITMSQTMDSQGRTWDAGAVLTRAEDDSTKPATREIYTSYVDPVIGSIQSMPFRWGSLNDDQKAYLNKSPMDGVVDNLGEKRVNYLRGSRSDEIGQANGIFRVRDRVLGDIVNSNPTYVGAPATFVSGAGYLDFYNLHKDRIGVVYVGANDGLLHAFKASDGTELFAYMPNALLRHVSKLTDPAYVHRPYVDGTMNVAEAKVGTAWKTVLVSGMGPGGQGVFALDVTRPTAFKDGSMALWEFTDKDDPDMGNVYGRPVIAKFRKLNADGEDVYKDYVVVANGFNSSADDTGAATYSCPAVDPANPVLGTVCNSKGVGALFLLELDKAKSDPWQENVNYYKFTTPVSVATKSNGLSAPALVVGGDGAVRYAYAGDLQGNLWRFDFTQPNKGNVAKPWASVRANSLPLFTAKDSSDNRQQITEEPKVVYGPGGYIVLFGTGKFLETGDTSSSGRQSFYGIYDSTYSDYRVTSRLQLEQRMAVPVTTTEGKDAMKITGDTFSYDSKRGWYMDFYNSASTGERSVTNGLVAYGGLFFNTLSMSNPCEKGGGRTYALCALSGLPLKADGSCESGASTGFISTVGMLSSPVMLTISDSAAGSSVGDRDSLGKRDASKKYAIYNFGTGGVDGVSSQVMGGVQKPASGRASWREVLNWQDMRKTGKLD
jgi:type IV pilus assembly protein PilY1